VSLVSVIGGFSFAIESKSGKIMDSFANLVPQYAEVVRDGKKATIASEDICIGDIVDVKFGDRIPADFVILIFLFLNLKNFEVIFNEFD
jgi:sodium/potassium-transporting ATPase subunit alpha